MQDMKQLTDEELMDYEGGFIITGTAVAVGVGVFCAGYHLGYSIGKAFKR